MKDRDVWQVRWERRRTEIVAELTPILRKEYPELDWGDLHMLVEKQADLRLVYERFAQEP
ncbi:MAG: hypothetical protein ABIY52_11010 [Gemmatimonadaceae bacterium]